MIQPSKIDPQGWHLTRHAVQRFRERFAPERSYGESWLMVLHALRTGGFQESEGLTAYPRGECFRCIATGERGESLSFRVVLSEDAATGCVHVVTVLPVDFEAKEINRNFKRLRNGSVGWSKQKRPVGRVHSGTCSCSECSVEIDRERWHAEIKKKESPGKRLEMDGGKVRR